MRIRRTEDCWLVVTRNQKWPDRIGFRAFTTEKAARKNVTVLGPNVTYVEVVCVPVTFTLVETDNEVH
jgi:hypothetical protein